MASTTIPSLDASFKNLNAGGSSTFQYPGLGKPFSNTPSYPGLSYPYNAVPTPAGVNTAKPAPAPAATPNTASSDIAALLAQIKAQQAAYAPPLNLSSIYNQSYATAQGNVNPYYSKQLQDFQTNQAANRAIQEQQTQMNIKNLQDQLANTLSGNEISGARTSQDVLANEQQAGIKADQQQQDQGVQFDQARIAQAKQLATQGLTTSGLGGQQVEQSTDQRNTQESRQAADVAQQQQSQELFKSRTFEDLARSGELAKQSETKGETQANFDLNNYIAQQGRDLGAQKDTLEKQRIADVLAETKRQGQLAVNNFIQGLSNPAQITAAVQKYGSYFA